LIKSVALLRRNPALTPQQFRDYWTNVHAPLVKKLLPHLVRYTGSFPTGDRGSQYVDQADIDAVVELWFPDRETMEADMSAPAFQTEERQKSSAYLMDMAATRSVVMEEIAIPL
jgi:uncharacterized protein (TIGR02118 family)